jgi:branched-chain amino acid transport system ATP-binding protein
MAGSSADRLGNGRGEVVSVVDAAAPGSGAADVAGSSVGVAVRDVVVSFGGVRALTGVSLEVDRGQVRGLIGPNGAGKTTLFDVISGLRRADQGAVYLGADDVTERSAVWRSRQGLRRTFQRQQIFGRLTVEENLLCAREWRGGGGGVFADILHLPRRRRYEVARRGECDEILELCGLTALRTVPAGSLPIGMARLVELGRALVDQPTVLLLDEPTSGLGHAEVAVLHKALDRIRATKSCAVLLVEHDIGFVMEECDRLSVLLAGTVLAEGTPAQIRSNAEVRSAYLG